MGEVAAFEVLEPGVLTSIQDLGRFGLARYGIPPSGASDPFSLTVSNLLVGNREENACLETTLMGLKLKALGEVIIAITGGDLSPTLNDDPLEMWRTHLLVEGDVIHFKSVRRGCRAYLAVAGGIEVPSIMGSRSTSLSGKFGGLEGRALKRGDLLLRRDRPLPLDRIGCRFPPDWTPSLGKEALLRVIPGPQDHHFTERGLTTFFSSIYRVTSQCDRAGVRLKGPPIERRKDFEESIISEGLIPGAIQVPGDGQPIILLTELVTGGYTKIATVISVDLFYVAQLKPGDHLRFEPISIEKAHRMLREQEERMKGFKDLFEKSSPPKK